MVSSTAERPGKTLRIAPSGYQGTFAPRNRVCEKTGDCPKRRARAWRFINDLREARWTVPRFFHRPNSKGQERTIEAAEPPRSRITKQTQFLITAIDPTVYTTVSRRGCSSNPCGGRKAQAMLAILPAVRSRRPRAAVHGRLPDQPRRLSAEPRERRGGEAGRGGASQQRGAHLYPWLHDYNWPRPHASLGYNPPIPRLPLPRNNLFRLHS